MYAREVNNQRLTFVVSGMLWNRSLVMKDQETGSLWSHLLGKAMQGPLRGAELEMLPSLITDWKTWRNQHPDTTVLRLSRTSTEYRREFYRNPSRFVLGIAEGEQARAWPFDQLAKQPVLNDTYNGRPVLVVFLSISGTGMIFDRQASEQTLEFELRGNGLFDRQTGSQWEPTSGKAVKGPLQGTQLDALPGAVSYRSAWQNFHPETQVWQHK